MTLSTWTAFTLVRLVMEALPRTLTISPAGSFATVTVTLYATPPRAGSPPRYLLPCATLTLLTESAHAAPAPANVTAVTAKMIVPAFSLDIAPPPCLTVPDAPK